MSIRRLLPLPLPLLAGVLLASMMTCTPSKKSAGAPKLQPVTLDGTYFVKNGKRFIPVGAHWVPAKAAMQWPMQWDPADIEADFVKMKDLGYTLVRFDMLWGWFEPRPGEYNAEAFKQLDYLVSLAHKYEVYLHPSMFIGGEVGEAYWDVPWRNGRNPHTDAEMLRLETNHAIELGKRYASEPAIIAWDLTDEPPFWITTGITDAQAMHWTKAIAGGLRQNDKSHPIVVGTSGQETSHGPFRADNLVGITDFLSVHPFTIYRPELFPDPMLSERSTYGAAFEVALARSAGRPAMVHEMGASSAQYDRERIAQYERANLFSALGAGNVGVNVWCFTDAAPEQRKKLPYLRTPQETEWGMTTWDRKDKPRGREFRSFAKIVQQLDLTGLAPAPADAAIVIPDEWSKPHGDLSKLGITGREAVPYVSTEDTVNGGVGGARIESANTWLLGSALTSFIVGRRQGLKADFPREATEEWKLRPIVMLPSPLTSTSTPFLTHVHSDFYDRAAQYVRDGGVLYASFAADAAVPDMDALFGAHLVDAHPTSGVQLRIVKELGDLKPGMTFTIDVPPPALATNNARAWGSLIAPSEKGEVVAVDQDNHPAIVKHALGAGTTVLVAYPIESWIASTPSAFEQKSFTTEANLLDGVYRALRTLSRAKPPFVSSHPSVEVTALTSEKTSRGYAIAVNHTGASRSITLKSARPIKSMKRLAPTVDAAQGFGLDQSLSLGPFEAAVLEFD